MSKLKVSVVLVSVVAWQLKVVLWVVRSAEVMVRVESPLMVSTV